jgi:hypothetical protein
MVFGKFEIVVENVIKRDGITKRKLFLKVGK